MTTITYHCTVNDLQGPVHWGSGPFARREWFALLEAHGHKPLLAVAEDSSGTVVMPLTQGTRGLEALTNWYAFTWQPSSPSGPLEALARVLARRTDRVDLAKLPDEDGTATGLERAFRAADWFVWRTASDTNHYLSVGGRSFAEYLATRPGPLRTTLKRKGKKVKVLLSDTFTATDWQAYEDIYRQSWKPAEGDPDLLRAFAHSESALGHFRFGMALADGKPVAAQFWTVEQGTAYIHKLAHLPDAEGLSPGTTLTAALLEQSIDRDRVTEVDFGTGDDRYKADWMEATRPRYHLTCLRRNSPQNWPEMGRLAIRNLVSRRSAG